MIMVSITDVGVDNNTAILDTYVCLGFLRKHVIWICQDNRGWEVVLKCAKQQIAHSRHLRVTY